MSALLVSSSATLALLLAPYAPTSSGLSVRMNMQTSEAAAKAAWLAKTGAQPSWHGGKVVPTNRGMPSRRSNSMEADMTCAWATDNYSAGSKADHLSYTYANPGNDHDRHSAGFDGHSSPGAPVPSYSPRQPSHMEPVMTCAWATDNYSAGSKADHLSYTYANPGNDHDRHSVGFEGPSPSMPAPSYPSAPPPRQSSYMDAEMTCSWATDNYSAGSKAAHLAQMYTNPGDDHDRHSLGVQ